MEKVSVIIILFSVFTITLNAQEKEKYHIPLIGEHAPKFRAETTEGTLNFPSAYNNKWKILFSHPKDFTPVCSSEILELASMEEEFKELNAALVVLSTDVLSQHENWKASLESVNYRGMGTQAINFPLVADDDKAISKRYGMLHPASSNTRDVRGVFIISPDDIVEAIYFYPMDVGRNFKDIERTLIALQTANGRIVTPANWNPGDDVMLSYLTDEENKELASPNSSIYQLDWFMTYMKYR